MKAGTTVSIECSGLKSPQNQQESVWYFTYFPGNCCTGAHLVRLHTIITSSASSKPVRLTKADALRPHQEKPDTTDYTTHNFKSHKIPLINKEICGVRLSELLAEMFETERRQDFLSHQDSCFNSQLPFHRTGSPQQLETLKWKSACQIQKWRENISARI